MGAAQAPRPRNPHVAALDGFANACCAARECILRPEHADKPSAEVAAMIVWALERNLVARYGQGFASGKLRREMQAVLTRIHAERYGREAA